MLPALGTPGPTRPTFTASVAALQAQVASLRGRFHWHLGGSYGDTRTAVSMPCWACSRSCSRCGPACSCKTQS